MTTPNRFLSRLSIRPRLIVTISALTIFALFLCGSTIYQLVHKTVRENIEKELTNTTRAMVSMVQATINASVRNHLKAIADKDLEIVNIIYQEYLSGKISEKEARERATKLLMGQKIGSTGYVYCLNSTGSVVVHPEKKLIGSDVTDFAFVRQQVADKEGFIEYEWANPGEKEQREKVLYMTYFEPWDWIISVSSYRSEFATLIDADDFRDKISTITLGKSGYVFIIGKDEEVLVHPWIHGTISDFQGTLGSKFLRDIYEKKRGIIHYKWKDRSGDTLREKLAIFEHLPSMDWIIASSVYTDEIYAPLNRIIYFVLFAVVLSLLLAIPLGAYVSNSITNPVNDLVNLFSKAAAGKWDTRAQNTSQDEIGILSRRFNKFMDDLQGIQCNLNTEVAIRQKAEYQRRLFEEVFNNAMEGITITDIEGKILKANPAFTDITGYDVQDVIGKNPNILKSEKHDKAFYTAMWNEIRETGHWSGEIWNRRKNGESYPELLSISAIKDTEGETTHYVAVFHDITEMKSKEEQIRYQAHHDALTGLPNRGLLTDRIKMAISRAKRLDTRLALFYLDLDNFKTVNDSLGHAIGDKILLKATERISDIFRSQDTISRLGGDEFVILVENVKDEMHLINIIEKLFAGFAAPFIIDGTELHITTSLGITIFPDDGEDAGTLIKNADMAMYQAKAEGRNGYHMYRQEMHDRAQRRLTVENALRHGVNAREFAVYYQPKINLDTGMVYGLEALVRWPRPDGSVISPAEFIPLAEETGLIVDIGKIVLETACKDIQTLTAHSEQPLVVSINLSGRQLKHPDILDDIRAITTSSSPIPLKLEFEITESTLMDDVDGTVEILQEISNMGFSLSIDDFGTGYSSLAYLKSFPINTLKIDRSFITEITVNDEDASIVRTIIDMSRNLSLDVVAEGVEYPEQSRMLKELGCSRIQGFLYGKPMPLLELITFLKSWKLDKI